MPEFAGFPIWALRMVMRGLTFACLAALTLAIFGGVLFEDRQFASRDAGNFYYPLYLRVQQEWDAGRWPLWAPEANGGTPLLGNPVTAVFYPGKLVFALLPYPWAARIYVIAHVLIAFIAMGMLLRSWQVSATGAMLGAVAYAFGAPVLSLTCNVIYLVGAAWAPLGFLAADRWLRLKRRGGVVALASVLALQVLGGDPEAAYVTVIAASGYAAILSAARAPSAVGRILHRLALGVIPLYLGLLALSWWSARARHTASLAVSGTSFPWQSPARLLIVMAWGGVLARVMWRRRDRGSRDTRGFLPMMAGLIGAAVLSLAIAGAQLLPSVEFSGHSFRASETEGYHDIYPFSVDPRQVIEAVWPNFYGTIDSGNRSWFAALPPKYEDRLWIPSLYLGGLTLVLASSSAGFRGGPPWRAWLTGLALVSLLAAFGSYASPVLWARCVLGWESTLGPIDTNGMISLRKDGFLQDGDGGVYWLIASALPVFRAFRYPGKFLVFTALAVSALAGVGWDRLVASRSRRVARIAGVLLAASLVGLATTWFCEGWLRAEFAGLAKVAKSGYGPLNVHGAIADLRGSLGHGALALGAGLVIAVLAARRSGLAAMLAVMALTLDLGLANARHAIAVPQSVFETTPRVLKMIEKAERADPSPWPFRVQRVGLWWPSEFSERPSPHRFEEIRRWERDTLRPNYHLSLGVSSTFVFDTSEMTEYAHFFIPLSFTLDEETARGLGLKAGQDVWYHPRRGYDLWNTRYFILPSHLVWDSLERGYASLVPRTEQVYPDPGEFQGPGGPARRSRWEESEDVRVVRNEAAFPRAWIVHRARVFPPVGPSDLTARRKILGEIFFQNDSIWRDPSSTVHDPHLLAWIESERPQEVARLLSRADPDPAETATITRYDPQRVELTAALRSPGLVVLADVYYPGWTATVDGQPAEILRTNRAMRGVALPAGTHRIVFRYDPMSFRAGVGLSMMGLVALAASSVWAKLGSRGFEKGNGGDGIEPIDLSRIPRIP